MHDSGLRSVLRRISWAPQHGRRLILSLAVMLVALAVTSIPLVDAIYDGRAERTIARSPVELEPGDKIEAAFRFARTGMVDGLRSVSVVYVEPLRPDATPPPGLDRWPDPGEVAVSPAAPAELVERLYGPVGEVIGMEGLGSPTEKLVYFRPGPEVTVEDRWWHEATGFGNTYTTEITSEHHRSPPRSQVQLFIVMLVVMPVLALLVVAARLGIERRFQHGVMLETLGASRGLMRRLAARDVLISVGIGVLAATLVLAGSAVGGLHLGLGRVSARDVRTHFVELAATLLLTGFAVAVLAWVTSIPPAPAQTARPRAPEPRYRAGVALLGVLLIAGTGVMAIRAALRFDPALAMWMLGTVLLTLLFASAITGTLLSQLGRVTAGWSWKRGKAATLVAGRECERSPRQAVRAAAASTITIVVISISSVIILAGQQTAREAEDIFQDADGRFAVVYLPVQPTEEHLELVLDSLPDHIAPLLMVREQSNDPATSGLTTITGTPENLMVARLEPGRLPGISGIADATLSRLLGFGLGVLGEIEVISGPVRVDPPAAGESAAIRDLMLVAAPGSTLDVVEIQAALNRLLAPSIAVGIPGDEWRRGAQSTLDNAMWVAMFGMVGGSALTGAAWLGLWSDIRASARRLAVVFVLAGDRSAAGRAVLLRVAMTALVGILTGALIGWQASWIGIVDGIDPVHIYGVLGTLCVVSALLALLVGVAGLTEVRRAADEWRPGRESLQ